MIYMPLSLYLKLKVRRFLQFFGTDTLVVGSNIVLKNDIEKMKKMIFNSTYPIKNRNG